MKKATIAVLAISILILTGCASTAGTNKITGNVVKEPVQAPKEKVIEDGVVKEQCGSYSETFKKIGECLGDLERGDDGYYYCLVPEGQKGGCGFDYTCFRDKRVVPCPTE